MGALASAAYDPAAAVSKSCASALAMTALDTTNLRLTFTAPSNGAVMVRLRGVVHGATTHPQLLLGVLDGSTVKLRLACTTTRPSGSVASSRSAYEAVGVVSGLTPGNSYTWDAAYGVEEVDATAALKYGGPNNTTANDAFGAFHFEVWETPTLLGAITYDPSSAATFSGAATAAMAAVDTTNLRQTITVPASGKIFWRAYGCSHGSNTMCSMLFGVMEGASIIARTSPKYGKDGLDPAANTAYFALEADGVISGLTPGASKTYDLAVGIEVAAASTGLKYGGPNNTTVTDAFGAVCFELWAA